MVVKDRSRLAQILDAAELAQRALQGVRLDGPPCLHRKKARTRMRLLVAPVVHKRCGVPRSAVDCVFATPGVTSRDWWRPASGQVQADIADVGNFICPVR